MEKAKKPLAGATRAARFLILEYGELFDEETNDIAMDIERESGLRELAGTMEAIIKNASPHAISRRDISVKGTLIEDAEHALMCVKKPLGKRPCLTTKGG